MMRYLIGCAAALTLAACNETVPEAKHVQLDQNQGLHIVCLDGIEYWYRNGTNAVLTPRVRTARIGNEPMLIPCRAPDT